MIKLRYFSVALLFTAVLALRASATPALDYLKLLRSQISASSAQVPQMTTAADEAAKRVLAGGTFWVGGTQQEFAAECIARAGGLKITKPLGDHAPAAGDVVLFGLRGPIDSATDQKLRKWSDAGTQLVLFGHADGMIVKHLNNDTWINCGEADGLHVGGKICPTDTVVNLANAWAFTGEFIAACTRRGKMPLIYESYGLPGGRERATKFAKITFHNDLKIPPIAAGVLAKEYYAHIDQSLDAIEKGDGRAVEQIASWIATAGPAQCTAQIIGHIFPLHCQDPRAPQLIATLKGEIATVVPTAVVLHIGYQKPPTTLLEAMAKHPFKFFYSAVDLGPQLTLGNLLRFNPQWPLADACVDIPGYDVPALPESGVINAGIYWSIVAQAASAKR